VRIVSIFKKFWKHTVDLAKRLISLHDPPHAIAGGAAIGMFFGFTPLFGLKTVLALTCAWIVRCSPVSAVIAVTLHDILLPLSPILLTLEYDVGYYLLRHQMPPKLEFRHAKLADMLQWTTFLSFGRPLLLGALVFAIPISIITHFLTLFCVKKYRLRKDVKDQHTGTPRP
jgi:uncharacterized protein (DUF2062 family)